MTTKIDDFVQALQALPRLPGVFNPWRDIDPVHDLGPRSPAARADHLHRYLTERAGRAKLMLIAEALGYQGGHFSGIAMTSERILLGNLAKAGINAEDVIAGGGQRTSQVTKKTPALGANEPTATIVWGALKQSGIDTRDVALWNAFAPDPMKADGAWLTNRKPTKQELQIGLPLLEQFMDLFPSGRVVAIGKVSEEILGELRVRVQAQVRHPANGGAKAFREGVSKLLG
ncbi:uracil-DNA glycosylase [Paucibacter soli]|uniref:uracil-DNA glycosylase n=1 Tax=Paucibacter soli TaxID=3133433 RepID=UPI0030A1B3C8